MTDQFFKNSFDGRMNLKRVSLTKEVTKLTAHQSFSDDVLVKTEI